MTNNLKPCPFCGGDAKIAKEFNLRRVQCRKCECMTGQYIDEEGYAVDDWNRRDGDKELAKEAYEEGLNLGLNPYDSREWREAFETWWETRRE